MKSTSINLAIVTCAAIALTGCRDEEAKTKLPAAVTPAPTAAAQPVALDMPDIVLVTVNGKELKRSEAAAVSRQIAMSQGIPPQMVDAFIAQGGERFEAQAVEHFVNQTVLDAEVARREIKVSEEDIAEVIATIATRLPEGTTVEQALEEQGGTMKRLREDIVTGESRRKLYEAETATIEPVTDEKVKAFYDENIHEFKKPESVAAKHILIACDKDADEAAHTEAKAKAEAVGKELAEGKDFAELAKIHSSCPSKQEGGNLGSFGRKQMVPEFEEAAFSQEVGVNGPVIKTEFGYHIVHVTAREAASTLVFADVAEDIRKSMLSDAKQDKFDAFLKGLADAAEITYAAEQK